MTDASTTPRASLNDLDPSDAAHRHTRSGVELAVVGGVQFLAARLATARSDYERAITLARSPAERVSYERRLDLLETSWGPRPDLASAVRRPLKLNPRTRERSCES